MTALDGPIADLAALLPHAAALIAHPDTGAAMRGGKPGSRPPWNQASADATFGAIGTIADWEAEFRYRVTGATGRRRPASATGAALKAIANMAHAVPRDLIRAAERDFSRAGMVIEMLPAMDRQERPQRITAPCPYCGYAMLLVYPRSGEVRCTRKGDCFDSDGNLPSGIMEIGRLGAQVAWSDGFVGP